MRIPLTEIYQPYGAAAHDLLCAMVCGTDIDIESRGTKYERTTGLIRVGDIDTSEAMIWVGRLGTMPGTIVIRY